MDARRFADEITAQLTRGEYVNPHDRMTVGELHSQWEPVQATTVKPKTAYNRAGAWRRDVAPVWASRKAASIRKTHVSQWVADMVTAGAGASRVGQAVEVLRQVLGHGVDSRVLVSNPAAGVKLPKAQPARRVYLTVSQVEAVAGAVEDNAGTWAGTLVRVAAYTGLRWGELTGLRVEDVDLVRRRLHVRQAVSAVGGRLVIGTPKTHEQRSVPLPASLDDEVGALVSGRGLGVLVFGTARGTPWSASNFRQRVWVPSLEDVAGAVPDGLRFHDLRHTAASLAISAGANVKAVQAMLGHASAVMTLDTYADLFPDDLDAVAAAVDEMIVKARNVELVELWQWWARLVATDGWVPGALVLWLVSGAWRRPPGAGRHLRVV
ncbi:MAG: site-specific integrase [Corynebacterium humireducens]|uniref:Site-specific integrase n=1 Tax=Corynebacterium humireducens TaxID=1223514 RepID=A0A7X6SUQ9_9CORY|nr:site-specific integrase [Corynebacterium humireducens]